MSWWIVCLFVVVVFFFWQKLVILTLWIHVHHLFLNFNLYSLAANWLGSHWWINITDFLLFAHESRVKSIHIRVINMLISLLIIIVILGNQAWRLWEKRKLTDNWRGFCLPVNLIFFSSLSQEMYEEHWKEMHVDIIV